MKGLKPEFITSQECPEYNRFYVCFLFEFQFETSLSPQHKWALGLGIMTAQPARNKESYSPDFS